MLRRITAFRYKLLNKTGLIRCRPIILIVASLLIFILVLHLATNIFRHRRIYYEIGLCQRSQVEKEKAASCAADIAKLLPNLKLNEQLKPDVRISASICGGRLRQGMTMLKSAILFSKEVNLHVDILQDEETQPFILNELVKLEAGAEAIGVTVKFQIHNASFPKDVDDRWHQFFDPCSAQRLFLPSILSTVDATLYVDTDTIFLSSLKELWDHFHCMDTQQVVGMAFDDEPGVANGYYKTDGKAPFYGHGGLNAGVMLMNLTKMRQIELESEMLLIMDGYNGLLKGDQDLLNVFFHYHPCHAYEISCLFNYGFEHCSCPYGGNCRCQKPDETGIALLHGRANTFDPASKKGPFAADFYVQFEAFDLKNESPAKLINYLESKYSARETSSCFKIDWTHKLMARSRRYIDLYFSN